MRAAVTPIDTWSSWFALVGIVSTDAGWLSDLFSLASAAAETCTIIIPEFNPGLGVRNAGRCERSGFTSCSIRRSLTLPIVVSAIAR